RAQIEDLLKQAKAKVGTLIITVDPPGAEMVVDGVAVENAPLPYTVFVEPGERSIEAQMKGYAPAKVTREVLGGGGVKLDLRLERLRADGGPPPPPPPPPPPVTGGGPNKAIVIAGLATTGVGLVLGVTFVTAWKLQPGAKASGHCNGACTHFKNTAFWSFLGA